MPNWLKDAVFYEIYPQSFYDTNGDGIGDINGVTEKLDYVKSLGCNAIWLNPCFESPILDAGYDVSDYKKVAPRYGTNSDLVRCFEEAHKRGMHISFWIWWPATLLISTPGFKRVRRHRKMNFQTGISGRIPFGTVLTGLDISAALRSVTGVIF